MHRIDRPLEPNSFLQYRLQNPNERNWDEFNSKSAYYDAQKVLWANQSGLCAYCEVSIPYTKDENGDKVPLPGKLRIEHFHAKADPDKSHNWMLDWNNIMGVCMAGGKGDDRHCDARKEDVQNGDIKVDGVPKGFVFEGYILNPYDMPNECLFRYESDGRLLPDSEVCARVAVRGNKHRSTEILVDRTIQVLNLNSVTLRRQRKAVAREYEQKRKTLRSRADRSISGLIAEEWFGNHRVMQFFTTRRCLLKGKAEPYIAAN